MRPFYKVLAERRVRFLAVPKHADVPSEPAIRLYQSLEQCWTLQIRGFEELKYGKKGSKFYVAMAQLQASDLIQLRDECDRILKDEVK